MPLISCEGVSMGYGGHVVIHGLNFHVDAGDYLCVVGENGAGKSTLVRGLLRLQPLIEGKFIYDGVSSDQVGYLPQRTTAGTDFPAGAYEVVLSGRLGRRGIRPFYSRADRTAALDSMDRLGISELRNKCFGELSGGQQQRVLLARAICSAGKLLILDEPTSGLDPVAAQDFYDMVSRLNSESGLAIIMVSHDVGRALSDAARVLHLNGSQKFFGPAGEYLASDAGKNFIGGP